MNGSSIDPNTVLSGAVAGSPSVFSFISQIDEFIGSLAGIGDTQWAQLAGDVVKGTLGKFGDWVRDKVGGLFSGSSDPVAVGSVQSMAQEMAAARGWTGAQWDALNWIVEHESSWNSNAQNPSSTAYGLFQFLDSTWSTVGASKTSDPAAQIQAGLAYIAQRYGSPSAAQAFWQANGWYDQGGVLPPGLTLAVNATGKNEAVLTNEEWATLRAAANAPATASPKELADAIVTALVAAKLKTHVVGVVDAVGDVLVTEILAGYEGSV